MSDVDGKMKALEDAVGVAMDSSLQPGEIVMTWVTLVATAGFDAGQVYTLVPPDGVPSWQMRGLLTTALLSLDDFDRDTNEVLSDEDDEDAS